jgi:hypothetical protein
MDDSNSSQTIFLSGPASLARILAQDQPDAGLWAQQEMRAMWEHQMSALIEADLEIPQPGNSSAADDSEEGAGFTGKCFRELLENSSPPLALLRLTKDFAKRTFKEAEDSQLKEIAAALYYTSYAAGLTRRGQRLGGMETLELRGGFDWALGRAWLDDQTKELLSQGRKLLEQPL